MSELFKIKGKFQTYTEKEISPTFTVRTAVFAIDNSYQDKVKIDEVPFEVWGKSFETAKTLKFGQEAEIQFRVGANKGYVKLSAPIITPGKEDDSIAF